MLFRSGDLIAYTGSIASSTYFPDQVEKGDETYAIDYIVCEAPVMEGGENVKVQQGASMAVTKSDEQHEYASCEFLKWFTQKENNMKFVAASSYMPVLKEANTVETLDAVKDQLETSIDGKVYDSLKQVLSDFDHTEYYTAQSFDNGYSTRKILDYNLSDQAVADKAAIDEAVASGTSREEAEKPYLSDEAFDNWYAAFCDALSQAAGQ